MQITSRINPAFSLQIDALILPKLTAYLPPAHIEHTQWLRIQGLPLADPHFATPGKIDLVLGARVYAWRMGFAVETTMHRSHKKQPSDGCYLGHSHATLSMLTHPKTLLLPGYNALSILSFSNYYNGSGRKKRLRRNRILHSRLRTLNVKSIF